MQPPETEDARFFPALGLALVPASGVGVCVCVSCLLMLVSGPSSLHSVVCDCGEAGGDVAFEMGLARGTWREAVAL